MPQKELLVKLVILFLCGCNFLSCSIVRNGVELARIVTEESPEKVVIRSDIDLLGKAITFPKGCLLVFKKGSISNGNLKFVSNRIKGDVRLVNCNYSGRIDIKQIDDRSFTSADDWSTLKFLLTNALLNGIKCDFYRDYYIDMDANSTGLIFLKDLDSGADITFHNCTIYNTAAFTIRTIRPVVTFRNVKNVTFRNCSFHDTYEHNSHLFSRSSGCCFLRCLGDCDAINLQNCSQENGDSFLRSGVYTHNEHSPEDTPKRGLTNSTLQVSSINTGYGLALYCGENLTIDVNTTCPHRGLYCAGVSNSTISYRGYKPIETKCHILIKDAVYKRIDEHGKEVLDMKGCHDLVIKAYLDEVFQGESVISLNSYGSGKKEGADFTFRSEKCHHYNINFTATINRSPETGYYFISRFLPESGSSGENDIYGCRSTGIRIHDVQCLTGKARPYICDYGANTEVDVDVVNCHVTPYNEKLGYGFDYLIKGNSTGKTRVSKSLMGSVLVRDKKAGEFDVVVEGVPKIRGLNYTNDNSSRRLVRIIQ